jgi:hypothetical protein
MGWVAWQHHADLLAGATARRLLTLFVAADTLFIGLHLVHMLTPWLPNTLYSVETERGFAEVFQHLKAFWIALMFALGWAVHPSFLRAAWAGIFGYLLADDAFQVHERAGDALAHVMRLEPVLGWRPSDLGQLVWMGILGVGVVVTLGVGYVRASVRARGFTLGLLVLLVGYGCFAGGGDALHAWFRHTPWDRWLGLIEDGGELVMMSWMTAYVFALSERWN